MALLELRDISKHFGAIEALRGVDFDLDPGEVVGLMGDNGAGKTNILEAISLLAPGRGLRRAATAAAEHAEHKRLLYVALTRAEERLILCGVQAKGEAPEGSWYAMAELGLAGSEPWLRHVPAN